MINWNIVLRNPFNLLPHLLWIESRWCVVWCDIVWYVMKYDLFVAVWYVMRWYVMKDDLCVAVWYDMIFHEGWSICCCVICYDRIGYVMKDDLCVAVWYDIICHEGWSMCCCVIWYDIIWYDMIRYVMINQSTIWYDMLWRMIYDLELRESLIIKNHSCQIELKCDFSITRKLNSAWSGSPGFIFVLSLYDRLYHYWMLPSSSYLLPMSASLYFLGTSGKYGSGPMSVTISISSVKSWTCSGSGGMTGTAGGSWTGSS